MKVDDGLKEQNLAPSSTRYITKWSTLTARYMPNELKETRLRPGFV